MAALQLTPTALPPALRSSVPRFDGLRLAQPQIRMGGGAARSAPRGLPYLAVRAATVVAPKYTSIKPLGDRVLVKIKTTEEKTTGGILLPTTAQTKPQAGQVVAIGEGRTIGKNKIDIGVQSGAQVIYSKYAGTELEFDGSNHLLLKEDDIVGILDTDDVKDLKPLNDRVLIKWLQAKEQYYNMHGKQFTYDRCWELVKNNPKFSAQPDPYPTGSKQGTKKTKGKKKISEVYVEPITDLTEDYAELLEEDPVGRPIGNKRALKAKRQKDSGGFPLNDKLDSMLVKVDEIKKQKEEEMHAKQQARQWKAQMKEATLKAHLSASKAQEDYYNLLKEKEIREKEKELQDSENKILFTPIEGLDERSKEHLIAMKNAIYERRCGL